MWHGSGDPGVPGVYGDAGGAAEEVGALVGEAAPLLASSPSSGTVSTAVPASADATSGGAECLDTPQPAGAQELAAAPVERDRRSLAIPASWCPTSQQGTGPQEALAVKVARFKDLCQVYGSLLPGDLQDFIERRQRVVPSTTPPQSRFGLRVPGSMPSSGLLRDRSWGRGPPCCNRVALICAYLR